MHDVQATNYFSSRSEAGQFLAEKLSKYRYEDCMILALTEGGVVVGAEIAKVIHSTMALLLTKDVFLPDGKTVFGIINENGGFVYNEAFSTGEIEAFEFEYRNNLDQEKAKAMHEIHMALGDGGFIKPEIFKNRVVIIVSDTAFTGEAYKMATNFLKPVQTNKIIMVAAVATVKAVDIMHVIADEINCLSVIESPFESNHYFENNVIPPHEETINSINDIVLNWQNTNKDISQSV